MNEKKEVIFKAAEGLTANYNKEELFKTENGRYLPERAEIIEIIKQLQSVVFPGYFSVDTSADVFPEHYVTYKLNHLYDSLKKQIEIALLYQGAEEQKAQERAAEITGSFFCKLPEIQEMLLKDVQAGFNGDPAAKSKEEIIFSYPGMFAIYVYRSSSLPDIHNPLFYSILNSHLYYSVTDMIHHRQIVSDEKYRHIVFF